MRVRLEEAVTEEASVAVSRSWGLRRAHRPHTRKPGTPWPREDACSFASRRDVYRRSLSPTLATTRSVDRTNGLETKGSVSAGRSTRRSRMPNPTPTFLNGKKAISAPACQPHAVVVSVAVRYDSILTTLLPDSPAVWL